MQDHQTPKTPHARACAEYPASIVGFPVRAGIDSGTGVPMGGGIQKVDGCAYLSAGSGSLGYTVIKVPASVGQMMIKAKMGAAAQSSGSPAKAFQAGLPQSFAFTMTLPKGIDAQVAVLNGEQFITVIVTRTDGDAATSQASAIAAAKVLIAAG